MTRILGIDPGTNHTGWAIIEYKNYKPFFIASGVISPNTKNNYYEKLLFIATSLEQLTHKYQPNKAILEESFVNSNAKTSLVLGMTRGSIIITILKAGLSIETITPTAIKKNITGSGKADKQQVIKMIELLLKISPKKEDEADAIAIALCGHQ